MPERIHITTSIIYANAPPHVGSAYEALATDTFVRYWRRKLGREHVTFVTGTDEHGQKNRDAAAAQGMDPQAFVDKIAARFADAWSKLNVSYDFFVRTTDPVHERFVQLMLDRTHRNGDLSFKSYEGRYCVGCERFYTEKELIDGKVCPVHNQPTQLIQESNYFLNLEKYRPRIRAHIERNADFIRPERYRNEALKMLAEPLADLCISRPKSRLAWGIEIPFDTNYVTYVWYDAFWAYLSKLPQTDDDSLRAILPVTEHFIGKDILKTHAVYWPAMLLAVGLPLYRHLNVHGWVNFGGARMSKSSGNIVDPAEYETALGADVLRYFLLRNMVYGLDGDFDEERMVDRYNADLANDLGNLTSRVLTMAARYFKGEVTESAAGASDPVDTPLREVLRALPRRVAPMVEDLSFNRALETIWQALDAANKYVAATAPFTLAKDPAQMARVAQILVNLLEGLRVVADTLEPFMPVTSRKMLAMLAVDEHVARAPFGEGIRKGHRVKEPIALFPRIEKAKPQ